MLNARLRSAKTSSLERERALRASEERFRLLVGGVQDYAIFMLDPTGHVVSWNAGAQRIKGYTADEIIGKHVASFYTPEDVAAHAPERVLKTARREGRVEVEGWRVRKNGSRFIANVVITAIYDDQGALSGFAKVTRDITVRKQAEEALRAGEARLAGIIDSAMDAIITLDGEQRIVVFNDAAEEMFGCRVQDIVGHTIDRFLPPSARPNHAEYIRAFGATGVTNRSMHSPGVLVALRADGTTFPIEASISQVDAAGQKLYTVIIRDVTERKRAEEALTQQTATLKEQAQLLDLAYDAIMVHDLEQGTIALWNRGAEAMYQWTQAEALGKSSHSLLQTQFPIALQEIKAIVAQEGAWEGELIHTRKDGHQVTVSSRWALRPAETDGAMAILEINRDVTERKRAEAERAALLIREQTARAEAEAAVHTRDVFLSIAAHELRTPLTALLGYAYGLQRRAQRQGGVGEREQRGLASITAQATRLNKLIEALLDLSRLQLGRFALDLQPTNLAALTRRVVDEVQSQLELHTIQLEAPQEVQVRGDDLRLEQVLHNLLNNAVKYSPRGGTIQVDVQQGLGRVFLSVTDQGMGIPETELPFVFSQFYRAANVDPRRISGLGIGLYVVHEIVTRHGGTITVESREGQGSRFVVSLPEIDTAAAERSDGDRPAVDNIPNAADEQTTSA